MSFHPEGSGGKGGDIMSTHFLIEGADTSAYRELRSIKGGLKSLCFSPLCCLLLPTAPSGGDGSSEAGPTCRMGPLAALTRMLANWWMSEDLGLCSGTEPLPELLFELLLWE